MKYIVLAISFFLLLVIQTGVLSNLGIGEAGNLLLVFAIFSVVYNPLVEGLWLCVIAGLMMDFLSSTRDGTMVVSFLIVAGFAHIFIRTFVPKDPGRVALIGSVAAGTVVFALSVGVFSAILGTMNLDSSISFNVLFSKKLIYDVVINSVFCLPLYSAYLLINDFAGKIDLH